MKSEFLDVEVDGGALRVARWGTGPETVVALHGVTASALSFAPVARMLDPGWTLVAPDLRGRGSSAGLPGPYGLRRHLDDVTAVIETVGGGDPVVLCGQSMGGFLTVLLAARRPDLVRRAVLVDGGLPVQLPDALAGLDPDQVLDAVLGPAIARLSQTYASEEAYLDFWRAHPALGACWSEDVEAYVRYDLTGSPPDLRSSTSEAAVRADGRELLDAGPIETALRALRCEVVHLRAERGLDDQPPGLQPEPLVARWRGELDDFHDRLVPDTNHYSIAFGATGAMETASAITAGVRS